MTEFGRQLPALRTPPPGPESRRLAEELRRFESPNVTFLSDHFPIFWERALGSNVEDVDGNIFVDLTSAFAVAAAGHAHPRIVGAVQDQAARLLHGMGDVHPPRVKADLLRKLAEITPGSLSRTILANSGSEAVEAALKTMVLATGRSRAIVFRGGYHGLTLGALTMAGREDFREPFAGLLPDNRILLPYPDPYRNPYPGQSPAEGSLEEIEAILAGPEAGSIGAIIAEPVQGRGGDIVPPADWLPGLRRLCDNYGVLLILDEIYTGFGRTGRWFACEHSEIVPDILIVGKALTGGMPFAACIATDRVMNAWPPSGGEALHTSTFLGHPLGCAAALASIQVIEEGGLPEMAARRGARTLKALRSALGSHPRVGEVRGSGLMIGIEMVRSKEGKEPDADAVGEIMLKALERGYIVLGGGVHSNVLSLSPALNIEDELLDRGVSELVDLIQNFE